MTYRENLEALAEKVIEECSVLTEEVAAGFPEAHSAFYNAGIKLGARSVIEKILEMPPSELFSEEKKGQNGTD